MLLLLCLGVIGFAVYAVSQTPAEERESAWPGPLQTAAVLLALPAVVLVFFFAPYLAALALLALSVAWWLKARPALPASTPRVRRRSRD